TVLGMKGAGNFSTDERPKNYRQTMLLLFPNASAPLTAILSMLKDEVTDDAQYKWFQKGLPNQQTLQVGGATSGATTIAITSGDEKLFKNGSVVLNLRTFEVFWVIADPTIAGQLSVVRGQGSVAGTAMLNNDVLLIIGSTYQEGVNLPTSILYDPTVVTNYCQ